MGVVLHVSHAERNESARNKAKEEQSSEDDPRHHADFRLDSGGDLLVAFVATNLRRVLWPRVRVVGRGAFLLRLWINSDELNLLLALVHLRLSWDHHRLAGLLLDIHWLRDLLLLVNGLGRRNLTVGLLLVHGLGKNRLTVRLLLLVDIGASWLDNWLAILRFFACGITFYHS